MRKMDNKKIILICSTILILISLFIFSSKLNNKITKPDYETQSSNNDKTEDNNEIKNDEIQNNNKIDNKEESKVILYLFHGDTCPACNSAIKNIKENIDKFSNIEIRTYEIWNNQDNRQLMSYIEDKLNINVKYIPFFQIDKYATTGYNEENLLQAIKDAFNNSDYQDIVKEVLNEYPELNPTYEILK